VTTTDAAVSPVHHDVANTYTIVSGVQNDAVNTLATVYDSHRTVLKSPRETQGQNQPVSTIRTLPVTEELLMITQSMPGQRP
jgi:hypothetical protein